MKSKTTLLIFTLIFVKNIYSNTCTSNAGTFTSWAAITWACTSAPAGGPPGCGDIINVGAGTTVDISADVDYATGCSTPMQLNIYGTVNFSDGGVRFELPAGSSVVVFDGGSIRATFSGGGSSTLISVGGENVWTAGMGDIVGATVLPIQLLSFTATPKNHSILIQWQTGTEVNNDYFTIEKSRDGAVFEYVATIDGAGNSTSTREYFSEDTNPWEGLSYYRLKQTDFNGFSATFEMVAVNYHRSSEFSFSVFPNPNGGNNFNVSVNADKENELVLMICDITGRPAYSKELVTEKKGDNIFSFNFGTDVLAPGMYMISISSLLNTYNAKMIVN